MTPVSPDHGNLGDNLPAMIRCLPLQRLLARLALVAALLMALAPSLSRWMAAQADAQADGWWAELCTIEGARWVWLERHHAPASPAPPHAPQEPAAPAAPAHAGGDCGYCTLVTPAAVVVFIRLAPLPPAEAPLPVRATPRFADALRIRGLGSRGPPLLR